MKQFVGALRDPRRLLSGPALEDVCGGRDNNLNLIRMVAALAVLVSHAWPIALGAGDGRAARDGARLHARRGGGLRVLRRVGLPDRAQLRAHVAA